MRTLQHIAWRAKVEAAQREGQKVDMLCGARKYPMPEMDDSIPTCTKCSLEQRRILTATPMVTTSASNVTWSFTVGPEVSA